MTVFGVRTLPLTLLTASYGRFCTSPATLMLRTATCLFAGGRALLALAAALLGRGLQGRRHAIQVAQSL